MPAGARIATVEECGDYGVPILERGCGISLAGRTCNVAVVIDFSKYVNRLLALDPQAKIARVGPGIIRDDLNKAAEKHQLTFGSYPATSCCRKTDFTPRALLVIGYPDLSLPGITRRPIREQGPIGLEAFQKHILDNMRTNGNIT